MFDNLLKYYLNNAQIRINQRIQSINEQRMLLKNSGNKSYKKLKAIKNSHLYSNKPKIVKEIRESDAENLKEKLTLTIAESLKENIKLKPDFKTNSSSVDAEIEMKKSNLEFLSIQDLLWGHEELHIKQTKFKKDENKTKTKFFELSFTQDYLLRYKVEDKFYFLLNLFIDLENNDEYSSHVQEILINYIPYAKFRAYEKLTSEATGLELMFVSDDYKNTNIDVFAEAVYTFCSTKESDEVMKRYIDFLYSSYDYESKDSEGRFCIKKSNINFQNFSEAFSRNLKIVLEPIFNIYRENSLGKRVYDIIVDDFKIESALANHFLSRSSESRERNLIASGKSDVSFLMKLIEASESYIEKLARLQQDFWGDIEHEYYNSEVFHRNATSYFSEIRYNEFVQENMIEQFLLKQEQEKEDYKRRQDDENKMIEEYLKTID